MTAPNHAICDACLTWWRSGHTSDRDYHGERIPRENLRCCFCLQSAAVEWMLSIHYALGRRCHDQGGYHDLPGSDAVIVHYRPVVARLTEAITALATLADREPGARAQLWQHLKEQLTRTRTQAIHDRDGPILAGLTGDEHYLYRRDVDLADHVIAVAEHPTP
ncbi:hypothetical protein ACQEVF_58245 [Nonomuraea polychroma]|uniref:hypothetical protein n=1 Tax=Nonomuraea polychroma TaxID=46176 RepID=UPI003D94A161